MKELLLLFILLPMAAAIVSLIAGRHNRHFADAASLATISLTALCAASLYFFRPAGGVMVFDFGVNLVLDGLSHLMLVIINPVSLLIMIYAFSYMEKYTAKEKFNSLILMVVAGMNGAVLAGDMISLFLFLELASVSSAALVAFGTGADETEASIKYMLMGGIASMFILLAIALIYGFTGSFSMTTVKAVPDSAIHAKLLILALIIAGFGTKAAIAPFHAWLPDAHPSAPAPVSAMLSGLLVKALGVYVLIRIIYSLIGMSFPVSLALCALGALSIITGSLLAPAQHDMKRMMACSTISQIGYMVLGIGLATPMGVMGGLLHMFYHSITKPLLFLSAGSVEHGTGGRDMRKLSGLRRSMPLTSFSSLMGSLAVSGIPPFGPFWSKLFIIIACVQAGHLFYAAVAVAGSIITLAYFSRMQKNSFFSAFKGGGPEAKESPAPMVFSMVSLALACLLGGVFFTHVVTYLINPAIITIARGLAYGGPPGVM